jgi:hypothetical protein
LPGNHDLLSAQLLGHEIVNVTKLVEEARIISFVGEKQRSTILPYTHRGSKWSFLLIPLDVAHDSGMISPTVPIFSIRRSNSSVLEFRLVGMKLTRSTRHFEARSVV